MINTMISEIDGNTVVGEIILLRSNDDKTILILEGDSDDKFLNAFIDRNECETVIAWGRDNALSGLGLAKSHPFPGILALIDRDYDDFLGIQHASPDIILSDEHDIEVVMFKSRAFEKVIFELGSKEKLDTLINSGRDPRSIIMSAAHGVGILRLHSKVRGLNLKFDGLKYDFIDLELLPSDEAMITKVKNYSRRFDLDHAEVHSALEHWRATRHNNWMMCCGHDLSSIFTKGLQKLFGSANSNTYNREFIERSMRLAFDEAQFVITHIFKDIRKWESNNVPYVVLKSHLT